MTKAELDAYIEREALARESNYIDELQPLVGGNYLAGANLLAPLLLEAIAALSICANRKECNSYECCGRCGPIDDACETIDKIQEAIK